MARYGDLDTQYFNDAGDPLVNGKVFFFETGTTTPKTTFADVNFTIPNPHPVILTAAGRQPNIFFQGVAKAILATSAGVQILVRDPVGETAATFGSPWVASKDYNANDVVQGSNGEFYVSLINGNVNNNPVNTTGSWTFLYSVEWNQGTTYKEGSVVTYDSIVYQSLQNANINQNPQTQTAFWVAIQLSYISTQTYALHANVVGTDGVLYTSLQAANVGNTPASSPTFWVGTSAAAAASATAALASQTAAATSATNAAASASTATTQATNASTSASNASTSATNAATSATNAAASASSATSSASSATSSASSATASASSATASASAASTSETNAAASASSASGSASTATTQASNALTSANNAATSETNAAASASNAATSAATATTQASNASTSATNAAASATNASNSASSATASASTATSQAVIATTQAGISTTQAGISTTKAAEAAASAATAAAIALDDFVQVLPNSQMVVDAAGLPTTLRLLGAAPNQAPLNATLGGMAYQSPESVVIKPQATAVPNGVGDMIFQATSNSVIELEYKGSDAVVRTAQIPLSNERLVEISRVTPLAQAVRVAMTAATSGSNGIQALDNVNLDMGTNNFTLQWEGSLTDWSPATTTRLWEKFQDVSNLVRFAVIDPSGTLRVTAIVGGVTLINTTSTVVTGLSDGSVAKISAVVVRERLQALLEALLFTSMAFSSVLLFLLPPLPQFLWTIAERLT